MTFNYAEALQKAIWFYDAQRSGELPDNNRVSWRGDSGMQDGSDHRIDLTGGWYDAGDHVKFGLPMASAATLLAWSVLETPEAYARTGQTQAMLDNLRWVNDYFIKAHPTPNEFFAQVGSGPNDHAWWGPAELMQMRRPSFKLTTSKPGSDVAGETAAAMAAASLVFRPNDPVYAHILLRHAEDLYAFADTYRGKYSDSIPEVAEFYRSCSGYWDELVWGALWLYQATKDENYLKKAEHYYTQLSTDDVTKTKNFKWTHSWDDTSYGCYVLLAQLTGKEIYHADAQRWLNFWTIGTNGEKVHFTPGGLAWLDKWGSLRYAANTAFLAFVYSDKLTDASLKARYHDFAVRQINYILGDNPEKRSYVVGFGVHPPTRPHHRTAHGSWCGDMGIPAASRHILYGALVGGPDADDLFRDDRTNFVSNEVAVDYNAGFTGALAWMVQEFGGEPLVDFPSAEKRGDELFVEACVSKSGPHFTEIRAILYNHTAWPARIPAKLSFRYYLDLSDTFNAGLRLKDVKVSLTFHQGATVSELKVVDERRHWYYVEVSFKYPGPTPTSPGAARREAQIRLEVPATAPAPAWNRANDFSMKEIAEAERLKQTDNIPVYAGGVLQSGREPG